MYNWNKKDKQKYNVENNNRYKQLHENAYPTYITSTKTKL